MQIGPSKFKAHNSQYTRRNAKRPDFPDSQLQSCPSPLQVFEGLRFKVQRLTWGFIPGLGLKDLSYLFLHQQRSCLFFVEQK